LNSGKKSLTNTGEAEEHFQLVRLWSTANAFSLIGVGTDLLR
jgi:hypothetical protein